MKYMYTAEETAQLRGKLIEDWVKPFAAACFEKYSQLQSIMLLVVQPESEFICDAIYDKYIFSSLKNPDLSAAIASEYQLRKDLVNLPEFDEPWEINEVMRSWRSKERKIKLYHDYKLPWEEEGLVVPAFAGFCKNPSTSKKKRKKEDYEPYAILRRRGEEIEVEIIGKMWRPSRDGISPLFLSDEPEYSLRAMAKNSLQGQFSGNYLYSEKEAAELRAQIINSLKPGFKACFQKSRHLKSATLLIAQYYNDEAHDAVHARYVFSVLKTPDLEAAFKANRLFAEDRINLPGLNYNTAIEAFWKCGDCWCSDGAAIPAFAAFCKEGEDYTPYAIFRRKGQEIEVEVVGSMLRPWLNGIKPEEYW